ncbi:hypothetical protein R3P38DRAFT_3358116 [Favolaschia claudopus]|uniref:Tyr recombinase domain-containing protein n=1 Tax=Favolaschia claudopus TaxID=2862362 RepID=A0AAW0B4V5_9AGAR
MEMENSERTRANPLRRSSPHLQYFNSVLECVIRGIRRVYGDAEPRPSPKIIASLSNPISLPRGVSRELADTRRVAYALAFAGFLRCGEITYDSFDGAFNLKRRDIIIQNDEYLTVDLPVSKTDPFRAGVRITIAKTGLPTCAYTLLRAHLNKPGKPDDPLFVGRRTRDGTGYGAFSRKLFIDCLKKRCDVVTQTKGFPRAREFPRCHDLVNLDSHSTL